MMDLLLATSGGESQSASGGYVDDVFSAYTYTGNGSFQTINNGIDLAGKGGLVWRRSRTFNTASFGDHILIDTDRKVSGINQILKTNTTEAQSSADANGRNIAFTSSGFLERTQWPSGTDMISWTFRKAPKFFDVVTYTGDGASNRQIPHSLGAQAGFVTVKATSTTGDWNSYHRSATGDLKLNLTDAQTASRAIITAADANTFTVSGAANTNGVSYVAYLWAHDPSADGIIQCGSFTSDKNDVSVNLGWEPQYVLFKKTNGTTDWVVLDQSRGLCVDKDGTLNTNNANSETSAFSVLDPTSTGFVAEGTWFGEAAPYIYLAIRRPNKPPTTGTQVYNAIARTGTGGSTVNNVGFSPDLMTSFDRQKVSATNSIFVSRLSGAGVLSTNLPDGEYQQSSFSWLMDGVKNTNGWVNFDASGVSYINHFFKRAPGFFDVVCDTGTGAAHAIAHNLTKAPELIIRKSRSAATQWEVWHSALAATEKLVLNSNAAKSTDATAWGSTLPTATQFTVGTGANVNANAATFVTYLFATLAGISKVGSYTGNGSSQTINCGFATGARFILIKRTDATGDWYVWDSVRGIIAANDPHLSLNTTAAEVTTDDSVDPEASGFIVNQNTATNINVNGGQYIFLAIA